MPEKVIERSRNDLTQDDGMVAECGGRESECGGRMSEWGGKRLN